MCLELDAGPAQQTPPGSGQRHRNTARKGLCSVGRFLKLRRGLGSLELGLSGGICAGGDELFAYQTVASVTEPSRPGPHLLRSVGQRDMSLVLERIAFNLCSGCMGFVLVFTKTFGGKDFRPLMSSLFSSRALQRDLLSLCSRPLLPSSDSLTCVPHCSPKAASASGPPWSLRGEHQWLIVSPAAFVRRARFPCIEPAAPPGSGWFLRFPQPSDSQRASPGPSSISANPWGSHPRRCL